jgi:hypothetical protein
MNMKKYRNRLALICVGLFSLVACNQNKNKKAEELLKAGIHTVILQDVIQTSQYTYLRLQELGNPAIKENDTMWAATSYFEPAKGDTMYYRGGFPMENFSSKELHRSFKSILFLDSLSRKPYIPSKEALIGSGHNYMSSADSGKGGKPKIEKMDITITLVAGFVTIADLYAKKATYSGKTIKIKGQVTKFSADIMGKNWVHIQDGTEADEKFDLTITTLATVKVGDIISFEGKIGLDRDLGHGYFYEVILEEAKIVK